MSKVQPNGEPNYRADSGFRGSEGGPPMSLPAKWQAFRQHLKAGEAIGPIPGQSDCIYFIEKGWACRSRTLASGKRQILALFLPGEHIGPRPTSVVRSGDRVTCLSNCDFVSVPASELRETIENDPVFARRFETLTVRQLAMLEEMVVSLGQRSSLQRVAHLLSDLADRQHIRGPGPVTCEFHLTQGELAEVLGLSAIHISRMIGELKARGLISSFRSNRFIAPDLGALQAAGGYEPLVAD